MIILPAIDLIGGVCVRLKKGVYETAEKVAEDPSSAAASFRAAGAAWLHTVDLDGAKAGRPVNRDLILRLAAESGLKIEVGGGIRTEADAAAYLEGGVSRVILGSAAVRDPALVKSLAAAYGERLAVGIDARGGRVATEGWLTESGADYIDLAKRMEEAGVRTVIFTDIARDGMQSGVNTEQLGRLAEETGLNVIASGGVAGIEDIRACAALGLYGCICGRAIYSGALDLEEAIREAGEQDD